MSEGKNQHYVPQFYFRRFSRDDSIGVLVRKTGFSPAHPASIGDQASRDYFYGNADVEKQITLFEGHAAKALRQLDEAAQPVDLKTEQLQLILQWLSFQRLRTAGMRHFLHAMAAWMEKVGTKMSTGDGKSNATEISRTFSELGPKNVQLMSMNYAVESADSLSDLTFVLLHNRSAHPFIFGYLQNVVEKACEISPALLSRTVPPRLECGDRIRPDFERRWLKPRLQVPA